MNQQPRPLTDNTNTKVSWLLLIGVILVGSNLRVPITSIGALISFIRDDLGISNATAGLITTLPLLAFALLSPFAPKIANRIGMEWTIALSLMLLLIGIIVRSLTGIGFLFTGTLFVGLAIAIGNVLIPGIIKMKFPLKIGLMTGVYAVFMNIFGALGSGLSVPISKSGSFGWQQALGIWGLLTLVSLLVWLPQLRKQNKQVSPKAKTETNPAERLWRSPIAWCVTLFMGGQSLAYYTLIAWLPDMLRSIGYQAETAGWVVFLMQFALIPTTFIMPVVAERCRNQVGLSIGAGAFFIIGFAGLLLGYPPLMPLWALMLGVAGGSAFSLSMLFFTIRTNDGKQAAELSGMAQSFGYLLAAIGPVLVGSLHDMSGSWIMPVLFLIVISIIVLISGIVSGKEGTISERTQQKKQSA